MEMDAVLQKLKDKCLMFEGIPVKCAGCGGWFHELTAKYNPDGPLRGSYLRLTSRYRSYGWYDFPHEDWVVGDNIMCPQCMMPYRTGAVAAHVLAWAKKHGAWQVQLGVTVADSPALKLYTSQGFRPVGKAEPLREGSPLMAQTMVLELDAGA